VLDVFNHVDADGSAPRADTSSYPRTEPKPASPLDAAIEKAQRKKDKDGGESRSAQRKRERQEARIRMILPPPPGFEHSEIGATVVAPCTHDKECPMGLGEWVMSLSCYFSSFCSYTMT
jgi:hypothetical protein